MRSLRRVLPALAALALLPACLQRLVLDALTPRAPFGALPLPAAPDYRDSGTWTALPERLDEADAWLGDDRPADPTTAPADVFYVHPTSYVGDAWLAPVDDAELNRRTDLGSTRAQATAFNGCCAVYGPRYRQANLTAFFDPTPEGALAVAVAYEDVRAAFFAFLGRRGADRPFLVVGHSQGAIHAARLLREEIAPAPLREKLVAAWLVGAPLTVGTLARDLPDVPLCATATQTGCVVAYNARSPDYTPRAFQAEDPDGVPGPLACVNPVTRTPAGVSTPGEHGGAAFLDAEPPVAYPASVGAACRDGTLVVTGVPARQSDFWSRALGDALGGGNHHPIEVQLFWSDLRANARERVAAWLAAHAPAGAPPATPP